MTRKEAADKIREYRRLGDRVRAVEFLKDWKFYIGDKGDEPMVIKIKHDQEFLKMLREEMIKNPEQGPR